MMNQRSVLQKMMTFLLLALLALPVLAQANEIAITARQNLALQSKPDYDSDVLGVFQRGAEAVAFGRNEAGSWLHIAEGWVVAKNVEANGDVMTLPITTDAVTVKATANRSLRSGPDNSFDIVGNLPSGETTLVLGRNHSASWLQVEAGWIPVGQVEISGDITALPVTFSSIIIRANYNVALYRDPSQNAEVLAVLTRGEEAIATDRNEAGTALYTPQGWVFVNRGLALDGEVMELPVVYTVPVTAAQALTLYSWPRQDSDRLAIVKQGEQDIAFGRDEAGDWLQIPGGWVSAEQGLELDGDVIRLSITGRTGIIITAINRIRVRSGPSAVFGHLSILQRGEEAIAVGRNKAGIYLRIENGWVYAPHVKADGDIMSLPVTERTGIIITAIRNRSVRSGPSVVSDQLGILQRGEKALAVGRNEAGTYLQIENGWVLFAHQVKADGDIMSLPVTSGESTTAKPDSITITLISNNSSVWSGPSGLFDRLGTLQKGEKALAVGRNEAGTYLQIENGWVYALLFKADGSIMSLPVTSGESTTQSTTAKPDSTPTPARSSASAPAFNEQTIRSLVNRHTDDIRILKIIQQGSVTTIEYDLKPWPFVPNEIIAHEVLFKVICSLRRGQQIPHKLEFVGQGHFKSDIGRKFTSPSVEIHISAGNVNRIVCSGNSYSDINWRSLSSFYKSYPVPSGASVDYD